MRTHELNCQCCQFCKCLSLEHACTMYMALEHSRCPKSKMLVPCDVSAIQPTDRVHITLSATYLACPCQHCNSSVQQCNAGIVMMQDQRQSHETQTLSSSACIAFSMPSLRTTSPFSFFTVTSCRSASSSTPFWVAALPGQQHNAHTIATN